MSRNGVRERSLIRGPIAATMAPRTTNAAAAPINVARQPHVNPTASTIVSASTISTAVASTTAKTRIVSLFNFDLVASCSICYI